MRGLRGIAALIKGHKVASGVLAAAFVGAIATGAIIRRPKPKPAEPKSVEISVDGYEAYAMVDSISASVKINDKTYDATTSVYKVEEDATVSLGGDDQIIPGVHYIVQVSVDGKQYTQYGLLYSITPTTNLAGTATPDYDLNLTKNDENDIMTGFAWNIDCEIIPSDINVDITINNFEFYGSASDVTAAVKIGDETYDTEVALFRNHDGELVRIDKEDLIYGGTNIICKVAIDKSKYTGNLEELEGAQVSSNVGYEPCGLGEWAGDGGLPFDGNYLVWTVDMGACANILHIDVYNMEAGNKASDVEVVVNLNESVPEFEYEIFIHDDGLGLMEENDRFRAGVIYSVEVAIRFPNERLDFDDFIETRVLCNIDEEVDGPGEWISEGCPFDGDCMVWHVVYQIPEKTEDSTTETQTTEAPNTTPETPSTTEAPATTQAPTTEVPATTQAPATTEAPATTQAPTTEAHKHNYEINQQKSQLPSCTESGYDYYECSCGDSYKKTIPALGHDLDESTANPALGVQCRRCQQWIRD